LVLSVASKDRRPQILDDARPVATPRQSKAKKTWWGAAVGAGAGFLAGSLYCRLHCDGDWVPGGILFGLIGSGIGAGVGVMLPDVAPTGRVPKVSRSWPRPSAGAQNLFTMKH
jgi:hypothetical protein